MSIDWFIPFHGKDRGTLNLSIDSIRRNFSSVGRIIVVTDAKQRFDRNDITVIAEPSNIEDVTKHEVAIKFKAATGSPSRTGWIWQQLLKLNADIIVQDISDVFVWQDADVLWCRKQDWHLAEVDAIIGRVDEYHAPYAHAFSRITGFAPALGFSTIRHHEYVRKQVLAEIRAKLAEVHGVSFTRAIVDNLDYTESSNFSEYDLYANWCAMAGKRTFLHDLSWHNINFIPGTLPTDFDFLAPQLWMRKS